MINYGTINVRRIIMHTIHPKPANVQNVTAYATYHEELFEVEENVQAIIRARLNEAAGKTGKSFKLVVEDVSANSFFSKCDLLRLKTNDEFVQMSKDIADHLAGAQTKTNYPGGFLLVIEATFPVTNNTVYIVIKAEPHDALVLRQTRIEKLSDIFLSPTQKFYKIGVLAERGEQGTENQRYDAYLFDDQFGSTGLPAEYFFKDFLGFSINGNADLQSSRFHKLAESFIKTNEIMSSEEKTAALDGLRVEFLANNNPIIEPIQFGRQYLPGEEVRGDFENAVRELPRRITKSVTLIKSRVNNKKLDFPDKIKISGPGNQFDANVKIVDNPDELYDLIAGDARYTIVLINGRPFDTN